MEDNSVSIVMPVHNQENIIGRVMGGILENISENVKEMIVIMDGSTDRSEEIIYRSLVDKPTFLNVIVIYTKDVWEVQACDIGFRSAKYPFILNIQDDMVIKEKNFDQILLKPFNVVPNLLAVTARDAVDCKIVGDQVEFYNVFGADVNSPKGVLGIRTIVNRGPLMIDAFKLKDLDYLDLDFIPITQDESALCLKGIDYGYCTGAFMIDYESKLEWGGTRRNQVTSEFVDKTQQRNLKRLIEKYSHIISQPREGKEIVIE